MSEPAAPYNSMPAPWCAARVAEARAWRDANSQQTPGWQHVHELLSQLDCPPLPAAPTGGVPAAMLSDKRLADIFKLLRLMKANRSETTRNDLGDIVPVLPDAEPEHDQDFYIRDVAGLLGHISAQSKENAALSARLQEAEAAGAAKKRELGEVYAHIFGDGGHRQAELEGQMVPVVDWLTGEETDELTPALPVAADAVLRNLRRLVTEAEAENTQLRAKLAQEGEQKLQLAQDLLAEFYAGGQMAEPGGFCHNADIVAGVNADREQNARWIKMRCAELGIAFPPIQRPHTRELPKTDAAAPVVGEGSQKGGVVNG